MMTNICKPRCLFFFLYTFSSLVFALPAGFCYLNQFAPSVIEDLRYLSSNNFVGHPIAGYKSNRCILTIEAAKALAHVAIEANKLGYSLKVYDCYRPQKAVNEFYQWSQDPTDNRMKALYYPREDKKNLFKKGYIARFSGHSRGSTIDLTLVKNGSAPLERTAKSAHCFGAKGHYYQDNSIDTGTSFDCFDESAHTFYSEISNEQKKNRILLRNLMINNGFKPYNKEWWHFTLRDEPYPQKAFNFLVE